MAPVLSCVTAFDQSVNSFSIFILGVASEKDFQEPRENFAEILYSIAASTEF